MGNLKKVHKPPKQNKYHLIVVILATRRMSTFALAHRKRDCELLWTSHPVPLLKRKPDMLTLSSPICLH